MKPLQTAKTMKTKKLQKQLTISNVSPYIYQMSVSKNYKIRASPKKQNTMKFDMTAFDLTRKGLSTTKNNEKTQIKLKPEK